MALKFNLDVSDSGSVSGTIEELKARRKEIRAELREVQKDIDRMNNRAPMRNPVNHCWEWLTGVEAWKSGVDHIEMAALNGQPAYIFGVPDDDRTHRALAGMVGSGWLIAEDLTEFSRPYPAPHWQGRVIGARVPAGLVDSVPESWSALYDLTEALAGQCLQFDPWELPA